MIQTITPFIMKINSNLVLWGVRMGYMSYGWDAGVLGGVLQTSAFQNAMKVRPDGHMETTTLTWV